ncbi:MAG: hypothetical protein ACYTG0_34545 [Planctomycetota bacterium]|jgi:hypothetical protein
MPHGFLRITDGKTLSVSSAACVYPSSVQPSRHFRLSRASALSLLVARPVLGLFDSSLVSFQNEPQKNGVWLKGIRYRGEPARLHAIDGRLRDGAYIGDYHIAYSVPTSGSFLIERNVNDFRVRYLDGSVWRNLFEETHDFGGTPLYPVLFTSNSDSNPSWQVALDNFSADVIPGPSTLVIWSLLGLIGVGWWRRQRSEAK